MSTIKESIHVNVPLQTAYSQWTKCPELPTFMQGAEITEKVPQQRVAWKTTQENGHAGVASFEPMNGERTRVRVELTYQAADHIGVASRRVREDLERFKREIEGGGENEAPLAH